MPLATSGWGGGQAPWPIARSMQRDLPKDVWRPWKGVSFQAYRSPNKRQRKGSTVASKRRLLDKPACGGLSVLNRRLGGCHLRPWQRFDLCPIKAAQWTGLWKAIPKGWGTALPVPRDRLAQRGLGRLAVSTHALGGSAGHIEKGMPANQGVQMLQPLYAPRLALVRNTLETSAAC